MILAGGLPSFIYTIARKKTHRICYDYSAIAFSATGMIFTAAFLQDLPKKPQEPKKELVDCSFKKLFQASLSFMGENNDFVSDQQQNNW